MTFKDNVRFLKLTTMCNFRKIGKFLLIILCFGFFLISVGLFFPKIPFISDLGFFFIWLFISLVIMHVQFIFHELAHFRVAKMSDDIKMLIEIQGPYGMRIQKIKTSSNELELKELEAPYIGLPFLFNIFLMLIQVIGTLVLFNILTQKWLVIPFFLLWIKYIFDLSASFLLIYWKIFSSKKTRIASIVSIIAGTDIVNIAYLKSIQLPPKIMDYYENYKPEEYVKKIEDEIADGKINVIYSDNKFTVY